MELGREDLVSLTVEVPVVQGALVTAIREWRSRGWGSKTIARELSVARNGMAAAFTHFGGGVQIVLGDNRARSWSVAIARPVRQGGV